MNCDIRGGGGGRLMAVAGHGAGDVDGNGTTLG